MRRCIQLRLRATLRWQCLLFSRLDRFRTTVEIFSATRPFSFYRNDKIGNKQYLSHASGPPVKKLDRRLQDKTKLWEVWVLGGLQIPCRVFNSFSFAIICSSLARILFSISSFSAWILRSFLANGFWQYSSLYCWNVFLYFSILSWNIFLWMAKR